LTTTGAVVIGGYVNGLGVVRALAARGVPVAVVRTQPFDIAHRSRHVVARAELTDLDADPESLVELLAGRTAEWRNWALVPTNDGALAALAEYRERLSSDFRVLAPPREVARDLLDKRRMLAAARAAGVPTPRDYGPATAAAAGAPGLVFPLVVKPAVGHEFAARFGCKLFLVADRAELARAVDRVERAGLPCSLHDFVPGPDGAIHVHCFHVDRRGEPGAGVTVRKLRQSPALLGVARAAELVPTHPGLREAAVEIVRRIGCRGSVAVEFKRDPRDGVFRFLEVNGRSVLYNALLRRGGFDFAGIAWSECVEGRVEEPAPNDWPGVWVNLHADLLHAVVRRRSDGHPLTELARSYLRPLLEAVWSARDPRPFLAQWGRTLGAGLRYPARPERRIAPVESSSATRAGVS
jgi:predicted ATP-grasp superfamily ATP-dependent carboligase